MNVWYEGKNAWYEGMNECMIWRYECMIKFKGKFYSYDVVTWSFSKPYLKGMFEWQFYSQLLGRAWLNAKLWELQVWTMLSIRNPPYQRKRLIYKYLTIGLDGKYVSGWVMMVSECKKARIGTLHVAWL